MLLILLSDCGLDHGIELMDLLNHFVFYLLIYVEENAHQGKNSSLNSSKQRHNSKETDKYDSDTYPGHCGWEVDFALDLIWFDIDISRCELIQLIVQILVPVLYQEVHVSLFQARLVYVQHWDVEIDQPAL